MKTSWKRIGATLAVAVLVGWFGVASPALAAKAEVEWMHWHWLEPGKKDIMGEFVDRFEKESGNTVRKTPVAYGQYRDTMFTRLAGGTAPDVVVGVQDNFARLISAGYLEPLDNHIDLGALKGKLIDNMKMAMGPDGKTYGIIQENIAHNMVYNKRLFEQAGVKVPTTIEEFWAAGQKITKQGDQYTYFMVNSTSEMGRMFFDLSKWVYGFDGRWARKGTLTLNDPNTIKAVEMYKKTYDTKMVPWGTDKSTGRKLFFQGKMATAFEGPYFFSWVKDQNPDLVKDLGAAVVPFPTKTTAAELLIMAVPKGAPHKAAAIELMKFWLKPETQRKYVEVTQCEGAMKGMVSEEFKKQYPWYTAAFDGAKAIPAVPEGLEEFTPEVQQVVTNKVSEVLHANKPAKTAMDEAQKEAQEMINRKK